MKQKKQKHFSFPIRTTIFFFVLLFFIVVASGNQRSTISTYNINSSKYVDASSIVSMVKDETDTFGSFNFYDDYEMAFANVENESVSYMSSLTGYGPDCPGCGGRVGCYPYQDVREGNVYHEDPEFGTISIVAADKSVPCGTVLRISNIYENPLVVIVLDRGGAIVDNKLDLLFPSQEEAVWVGRRNNIYTEVLRWGW